VTRNNNTGPFRSSNWNENNLKSLPSINWRASLVPAAAVIPAPIAYIKVVAVKKLVVGFLYGRGVPTLWMGVAAFFASSGVDVPHLTVRTLCSGHLL
jgi:hypothetical protein